MTTNQRRRFVGCLLLAISGGCAGHGPAHVAPDESRPHITWEIRTGNDIGDEQFVCGSARPATPCVLTAGASGGRTLTTAHLYLHAAAQPTNYLGVLAVPFVGGSERIAEREVSATVRPGDRPYGVTVTGLVNSKLGSYALRVRLDATQANSATPTRITEEIPVTVK